LSPNLPQTFDELTYRPIPPEDISKTQEGIRPLPKAPSRKKKKVENVINIFHQEKNLLRKRVCH
jgi:glycerol-3-phosphate dehydrogenase